MKSHRCGIVVAAMLTALTGWRSTPASAEVAEIRITRQPSVIYLPMVVMEHEKLVEKHAVALGLPNLKASWVRFSSGGASTDALLSGNVDLVTSGVTNLALLWTRTHGQVKGVSAASGLPMYLVTRNPNVKTIKDFGPGDRIAVPTIKVSSQATMLMMALDAAWGEGGRSKLDANMVQLGHPEAAQALANPNGEIDSHYSASPFQEIELKLPGVHRVLNSADTMGGPVTNTVVFATKAFHDANPKTIGAFLAALDEANGLIATDKRRAAQIYLEATGEKIPLDDLVAILNEPDVVFSSTPQGTMKLVSFMAKEGLLKEAPASWKDLFFPEMAARSGS